MIEKNNASAKLDVLLDKFRNTVCSNKGGSPIPLRGQQPKRSWALVRMAWSATDQVWQKLAKELNKLC
jgi:hypothetical protein